MTKTQATTQARREALRLATKLNVSIDEIGPGIGNGIRAYTPEGFVFSYNDCEFYEAGWEKGNKLSAWADIVEILCYGLAPKGGIESKPTARDVLDRLRIHLRVQRAKAFGRYRASGEAYHLAAYNAWRIAGDDLRRLCREWRKTPTSNGDILQHFVVHTWWAEGHHKEHGNKSGAAVWRRVAEWLEQYNGLELEEV